MDFEIVNLRLLAHPLNWAIVWVTLLLALLAYTHLVEGVSQRQANLAITPD